MDDEPKDDDVVVEEEEEERASSEVVSDATPAEQVLRLKSRKNTKALWRLAKARATEKSGDALVALTELLKLKEETLEFDTAIVDPVNAGTRTEMLAPVGPLGLIFALFRPGTSQVRHVVSRLWNLTWGIRPLMLLAAVVSLLVWVGGLVCLPGLAALALRLAYNGNGIAQLKLEMFVVWFILCAIALALANVLNQFILGRNRTNLAHTLSSRILFAKEAYPDLLTKEDLHTFLVKDMKSLRRMHVCYHRAIERSLVCVSCWVVLMARSPMLGLLALGILFASILVTSASDIFNHSRGSRSLAGSSAMGPNADGTTAVGSTPLKEAVGGGQDKDMMKALAYITREEKFEQNMHMIVGGAMVVVAVRWRWWCWWSLLCAPRLLR